MCEGLKKDSVVDVVDAQVIFHYDYNIKHNL